MIQLDIFVGSNHFISTFYDFAAGDGTHTSSQTGNLVFQASGPTVCPTACPGVTPTINAPTNTPILFRMSILAGVDGFLGTSFGFAEASNTLYFPLTGPVFNLPAGFSASIAGLSVEDNRVVGLDTGGGGSVPEPATCGLVGAGLALAALFRRRR
ncbi:MAG: PEP-CTERM sorting domain-containing protein [Acidobacteriota bacterium]